MSWPDAMMIVATSQNLNRHQRMKNKDKYPLLSFNKAFDALSRKGARLMLMHTVEGDQFFVVPGGRVTKEIADKLMMRANMEPFEDGLFPGHQQSWRIAGT